MQSYTAECSCGYVADHFGTRVAAQWFINHHALISGCLRSMGFATRVTKYSVYNPSDDKLDHSPRPTGR